MSWESFNGEPRGGTDALLNEVDGFPQQHVLQPVEHKARLAVSLPVRGTNASTAWTTASSVPACAMKLYPGMNGAGLEKCTPRKRSGRSSLEARSPIGRVEVLLPMTAP
jgi:hypothetical protein